jgi:Uma2 family endonuclease
MSDSIQANLDGPNLEDDPIRYEVYEGVIIAMVPPSSDHQTIAHEVTNQLNLYFKGKKCKAYIAPFDVDLTEFTESKKKTKVQPDITVICDPSKLNRRTGTYTGTPTMVVEVASPLTIDKDLGEKKSLYEKAGILEYLLILDRYSVMLFTLQNGTYQKQLYEADETGFLSLPVGSFPGLTLEMTEDWFWFEQ